MDKNRKIITQDIANQTDKAKQELIQQHDTLKEHVQEITQKAQDKIQDIIQQVKMCIRSNHDIDSGVKTIMNDTEKVQREIQGDKDRLLQALSNEKTKIFKEIQTKAMETK
jgi:hypothetical protein